MADEDLLLSRVDGTRLPVRDYSREFAAERKSAGLKAIPWASCGTRISRGCARRASPPMWLPPGTVTPSA